MVVSMRSQPVLRGAGLRRVDWVRLDIDDREVRATAVGVRYRLPASCPISLELAADLVGAGVPSVTHTVDGEREGR